MPSPHQGVTGPENYPDGKLAPLRLGRQGNVIASRLHGSYYEANARRTIFTNGLSNTVLNAANAIATGLGATARLAVGLYNPFQSPVNLVVLQTTLNITTIAASAVNEGGWMWVKSIGNRAITTGSTANICCRTLANRESIGRSFLVSTACTGLTNNLSVVRAAAFDGLGAAGPLTQITQPTNNGAEVVDGLFVIPPGCILGIMNRVSTTTINISVGITWEEVPI